MTNTPDARASVTDAQSTDPRTGLAKERTSFAKFRTQLALDRTTLAWIRTALTMATFGFGTVGFFRSLRESSPTPESVQLHASAIRFGMALIVLGVAATLLSGITHWRALRRLRRDELPILSRWPLSITVAVLLAIVGLASLWDLLGGITSWR
jgi:putative membrane protein